MKTNKNWTWIISIIVIEVICAGMGMGVPIFNIISGFPLGWFLANQLTRDTHEILKSQRKVFNYALMASAFTFLLMVIIWGMAAVSFIFDPTIDKANFGEPLILFTPVASFYGWLVLMIVISPFLQLLSTIFAAYVTPIFIKPLLKKPIESS